MGYWIYERKIADGHRSPVHGGEGFDFWQLRKVITKDNWVVVSNIFYFHPYLGRISNLTNIFQMG